MYEDPHPIVRDELGVGVGEHVALLDVELDVEAIGVDELEDVLENKPVGVAVEVTGMTFKKT